MSDTFVDFDALSKAAEGVNGTLDMMASESVTAIPHDASAAGHERLGSTLSDFLSRWERGVDNLAKDGRQIASFLTTSVRVYQRQDQAGGDEINSVAPDASTNPEMR